jgi:Spy/CpxP family protein refolding chaperone
VKSLRAIIGHVTGKRLFQIWLDDENESRGLKNFMTEAMVNQSISIEEEKMNRSRLFALITGFAVSGVIFATSLPVTAQGFRSDPPEETVQTADDSQQQAPGFMKRMKNAFKGHKGGMRRNGQGRGMAPGRAYDLGFLKKIAKKLELTPEQLTKIEELAKASHEKIKATHEEIKALHEEMFKFRGDLNVSKETIFALVDKISAKETEIKKTHIGTFFDAKALLTPEQVEKVKAFLEKRKARFEKMGQMNEKHQGKGNGKHSGKGNRRRMHQHGMNSSNGDSAVQGSVEPCGHGSSNADCERPDAPQGAFMDGPHPPMGPFPGGPDGPMPLPMQDDAEDLDSEEF